MQRDRALVCAVFFCTLKISEATALKLSDFHINEKGCHFSVTKNIRQRTVSVPNYASKAIQDYIEILPGYYSNNFLFCTFIGKSNRIKANQKLARDSARKSLLKNRIAFSCQPDWSYNLLLQGGIVQRVTAGAEVGELI
jgi:site-specific recombinase XerC